MKSHIQQELDAALIRAHRLDNENEKLRHEVDNLRVRLAAVPQRAARERASLERLRTLVEDQPEALVGMSLIDIACEVLERCLRQR